jgi:hypothetical protein
MSPNKNEDLCLWNRSCVFGVFQAFLLSLGKKGQDLSGDGVRENDGGDDGQSLEGRKTGGLEVSPTSQDQKRRHGPCSCFCFAKLSPTGPIDGAWLECR